MKRGIALLNENTGASLTAAVALFDRALEIRRATFASGDHWAAYLTAASWMNRGDALTRLAQPEGLEEAVRSYDEAIALMREVPLEINPLYRRRLAIAWMNRGITLQQRGTESDMVAAIESFEQGIAVVRDHPDHVLLLAGAWMNRANALLRITPPRAEDAHASALNALHLTVETETQDVLAAETSLKSRYIICQAVAERLAASPGEDATELTSAATDALEEGMRLAQHWEASGEKCFRPLLADFFRFGLAAYRLNQPHFVAEFVREHLDSAHGHALAYDPQMLTLARETLQAIAGDLQSEGFAAVRTPRFDSHLETLRALQFVEGRLRELENPKADPV